MIADRMDAFEPGTSMIAMRSGVPVVPIYMHNTSYSRGRAQVIVGDPIYSKDSEMPNASRRENEKVFTQRIMNSMNALKKELDSICG